MKAVYNVDKKKFECFCIGKDFATLQKFKSHCKTKSHQDWKEQWGGSDEMVLPTCPNCFDVLHNPFDHDLKCGAKNFDSQTLQTKFETKLEMTKEKVKACTSCSKLLFLGTLSSARLWKEQLYCITCFRKLFSEQESLNKKLLKVALLHQQNAKCPLCTLPILTAEETIYEHMNPFEKTHDPSACLRTGQNVQNIYQQCLVQGVQIVHLICAQLKTMFEGECGQFQNKKNLKRKSTMELDERKQKKTQYYQKTILPCITQSIQKWTQKHEIRAPRIRVKVAYAR